MMTSASPNNFAICFAWTVGQEGNYSDDPTDPGNWTGGKIGSGTLKGTMFGISAASYPDLDIGNLTMEAAQGIYQSDYWAKIQGDFLALPVARAAFDSAVNDGVRSAILWLQAAAGVSPDGKLGPITIAAANAMPSQVAGATLVHRMIAYTSDSDWLQDGLGWTRRVIALAQLIGNST
jgi:lysozyme family protein